MIFDKNFIFFADNRNSNFIEDIKEVYLRYKKNKAKDDALHLARLISDLGDEEFSLFFLESEFLGQDDPDPDAIQLIFEIYLKFKMYDDAFNLIQRHRVPNCQDLMWRFFKNSSDHYDINKLLLIEGALANANHKKLIREKINEILDINSTYHNVDNDLFENLKNNGQVNLIKKIFSIKFHIGEKSNFIVSSLASVSGLYEPYFKQVAFNMGLREYYYSYLWSLSAFYRLRLADRLLKENIESLLEDEKINRNTKYDLLHLDFRVSRIMGENSHAFILSELDAERLRLSNYYEFKKKCDFEFNSNKLAVSEKGFKRLNGEVALVLTGQIRGEIPNHHFNSFNVDRKLISTWENCVLTRTNFFKLNDIFSNKIFKSIPYEYSDIKIFKEIFPRSFEKITSEIFNFKNKSLDVIDKSNINFDITDIHEEKLFEDSLKDFGDNLKVNGSYNQAKMFYLIGEGVTKAIEEFCDVDIIIRSRPDLIFDMNKSTIDFCIEKCRENENLIFVPCIAHNGFSDQFCIGSKNAMNKCAKIWEYILAEKKIRYKDYFSYKANRGAEILTENHFLHQGLEVRYIYLAEKKLLAPKNPADLVDYKNEFQDDYSALDGILKKKFQNMYSMLLGGTK